MNVLRNPIPRTFPVQLESWQKTEQDISVFERSLNWAQVPEKVRFNAISFPWKNIEDLWVRDALNEFYRLITSESIFRAGAVAECRP